MTAAVESPTLMTASGRNETAALAASAAAAESSASR